MNTSKTLIALAVSLTFTQYALAQETLEKTKIGTDTSQQQVKKINVLNSDMVDKQLIGDIHDTVRYIPGVSVSDTGNRFSDNGFNIRGMEGDSVAILVDGLSQGETLDPLSFSRYGMFSSTRNAVEVESVKSVEVLKGANSVSAGSGALGGAVIYTTKDADDYLDNSDDAFGGAFKLGYDGRNSEKLANLALAKRFGKLEALAIYTLRKGNETKAHDDGADIVGAARGQADPFDADKTNLLLKLEYQFNPQHSLGLVYEDHSKEREGTPLSRQSTTYFDFTSDDETSRKRTGLFYHWTANNLLFDELEFKLDSQEIYTQGITNFGFSSRGQRYLRSEDRNYQQDMQKFTLDLNKIITGSVKHQVNYGISAEKTEVENSLKDIRYKDLTKASGIRAGYPIVDPSWVPKTDKDTTAMYISDLVELNDQWTLFAGLRYDKTEYSPTVDDTFKDPTGNAVSDADFSSVTGKFSAQYEFIPQHSLTASVATGYKAPTTQELYLNTNGTGEFSDVVRTVNPQTGSVGYTPTGRTERDLDTVTNPNLDAEEGINYELAYQWQTETGFLKVNLFRSNYDNQIININQSNRFAQPLTNASFNWFLPQCQVAVLSDACWAVSQITGDTWGVPTNTGKTTISGFEIEAGVKVSQQINLTFSHSQARGEYDNTVEGHHKKGDDLESISPNTSIIGATFDANSGHWGFSAYARFIDGKDKQEHFSAKYFTESATVVDMFAYYDITPQLSLRGAILNLFDKKYHEWNRVRNVRDGSGGFFGGVTENGIDRFTQPGRELTLSLNYSF